MAERVDRFVTLGPWACLWLVLFGCRHRAWFQSAYGPRCARCLKEVPGDG